MDPCRLPSDELTQRLADWASLAADARTREEVDGGVRLTFGPGALARVASLVEAELACCPTFDFEVALTVTEPVGSVAQLLP